MKKCKQLMGAAFDSMSMILQNRRQIDLKTRLNLYTVLVRPNFTYNMGAATYTQKQLDIIETQDRKQLRIVLGIFYPAHIHNDELHTRTNTRPLGIEIEHAPSDTYADYLTGPQRGRRWCSTSWGHISLTAKQHQKGERDGETVSTKLYRSSWRRT